MRYGFTTGSCAAAAAKAAAYMLLSGNEKTEITINTPKGIPYKAQIQDITRTEKYVSCAVEKDGGDDPDITKGTLIYATVSYPSKIENGQRDILEVCNQNGQKIHIDGGIGVGIVTKPGLDQPVGNAAINHVPRQMIEEEVRQICQLLDYEKELNVIISVPNGEEIAQHTFNPRLGIEGGISIIGTSGIVEPMSSQALLDTIQVELRQRWELGFDHVAITPGNYGLDFMKKTYGYNLDRSVKCSNFIGNTIDMAVDLGFQKLLLTGHIGKLIKVAGGIMNTHSREADCRMELLVAFALRRQVSPELLMQLFDCVTTEEAIRILEKSGCVEQIMQDIVEKICYYLNKRAKGKLKIDCILYANDFGELAKSKEAEEWFTLLAQEQEQ